MEKFQKAAEDLEKDCFNLNSQFCIVNEKYKGAGI